MSKIQSLGIWMTLNKRINDNRTKTEIVSSPTIKGEKNMKGGKRITVSLGFDFSERDCDFSLRSRAIGPLESFGARRKVVLGGEGNAWVPVLGSFYKLRKVGVLSYLSYTLFKCFVDDWVGLRP